ncbi:MAG: hypothetical protein R3248_01985 [Candidatus Promineifilaceae bacterium]|nr:hypothetical protein [Candidatus Promineifilaceae bacterium]
MPKRCPHCDQLIMEDEAVCWNCGQPTGVDPPETESEKEQEETTRTLLLSPVAIYTALTAVVIVSALLLTTLLGRLPRLQAAGIQPPEEWQRVTDENETFTLFLPPDWRFVDPGNEEERATLTRLLAENDRLRDALFPWYQVRDLETLFLAASDPPEAAAQPDQLFLVARSATLNQLSYIELISVVERSDVIISAAEIVDDFDRRYAYAQLRTRTGLFCQQQYLLGDEELLLTAFCASPEEPSTNTLELVRRTFQRLDD